MEEEIVIEFDVFPECHVDLEHVRRVQEAAERVRLSKLEKEEKLCFSADALLEDSKEVSVEDSREELSDCEDIYYSVRSENKFRHAKKCISCRCAVFDDLDFSDDGENYSDEEVDYTEYFPKIANLFRRVGERFGFEVCYTCFCRTAYSECIGEVYAQDACLCVEDNALPLYAFSYHRSAWEAYNSDFELNYDGKCKNCLWCYYKGYKADIANKYHEYDWNSDDCVSLKCAKCIRVSQMHEYDLQDGDLRCLFKFTGEAYPYSKFCAMVESCIMPESNMMWWCKYCYGTHNKNCIMGFRFMLRGHCDSFCGGSTIKRSIYEVVGVGHREIPTNYTWVKMKILVCCTPHTKVIETLVARTKYCECGAYLEAPPKGYLFIDPIRSVGILLGDIDIPWKDSELPYYESGIFGKGFYCEFDSRSCKKGIRFDAYTMYEGTKWFSTFEYREPGLVVDFLPGWTLLLLYSKTKRLLGYSYLYC